ncbi:MAG: hypothetical protein GY853_04005 [PVC group bacterium]|nr:hypothetical protein [PVC group bacterium]
MGYLAAALLAVRPFVCEQASLKTGLLFNAIFLLCVLSFFLSARRRIINLKILIAAFIFPGSFLILSCFSVNSFNSYNQITNLLVFSCIFIFVLSLEKRILRFLISSMIVISVVVAIRGIYQYFYGFTYIINNFSSGEITGGGWYAAHMLERQRAVSFFGSPNLLASYLITLLPLSCAYLIKNIRKGHKVKTYLFAVVFTILFGTLLLTKTVGAFLALIISMIWFGLKFIKNKWVKPKKIICFLLILFIFCGFIFLKRTKCFLNLKNPQNSVIQRLYYWQSALSMIRNRSLQGVGAGNYGIVYPRFKSAAANETIYTHNIFLQIWAEGGVLPLLCFIVFIAYVWKRIKCGERNIVALGILSGSIAVLIHNNIDYSFFISQTGHLWWIFTACALNMSNRDDNEKKKKNNNYIVNIILYSIILILGYKTFFYYQAELNFEQGMVFFQEQKYEQARELIAKSLKIRSDNDFAYYNLATIDQIEYSGKYSEEVVSNYKKAISLNPDYAFYYYELGQYFKQYNREEQAEIFLKKAVKAYPTNLKFITSLQKK